MQRWLLPEQVAREIVSTLWGQERPVGLLPLAVHLLQLHRAPASAPRRGGPETTRSLEEGRAWRYARPERERVDFEAWDEFKQRIEDSRKAYREQLGLLAEWSGRSERACRFDSRPGLSR